MKGQKLLVRRATDSDEAGIGEFFHEEGLSRPATIEIEFIGKIVGDIVAFAGVSRAGKHTLTLESLRVSFRMRRKRVGRGMMKEIERWAHDDGFRRIVLGIESEAQEFFERVGFERVNGALVRRVGRE